jgi:predicted RNA binding protein YcfA (HicA-like mRNA interferase family)
VLDGSSEMVFLSDLHGSHEQFQHEHSDVFQDNMYEQNLDHVIYIHTSWGATLVPLSAAISRNAVQDKITQESKTEARGRV